MTILNTKGVNQNYQSLGELAHLTSDELRFTANSAALSQLKYTNSKCHALGYEAVDLIRRILRDLKLDLGMYLPDWVSPRLLSPALLPKGFINSDSPLSMRQVQWVSPGSFPEIKVSKGDK